MYLGIDFDGTLVQHEYPDIGSTVPGAFEWLKKFQEAGAKLILYTMRSDSKHNGPTLTAAVDFCKKNGIEFFAVNENPTQKRWTESPKIYCHHYVDDAAIGCPLKESATYGGRPYVDWEIVGPMVMERLK